MNARSCLVVSCIALLCGTASATEWPTQHKTLSAGSNLLTSADVGNASGSGTLALTGDQSGSTFDGLKEGVCTFSSCPATDAVGTYPGQELRIYNDGTANITVVHHSSATGVDSTNWIKTVTGSDIIIKPGEWITLAVDASVYDVVNDTRYYYGWIQLVDRDVYIAGTPSTPSRSVGTAWQPNTARATLVVLTLSAACNITLTGGAAGHIDVLVGPTSSPTTVIGSVACGNTGTVVVGFNGTVTTQSPVSYIVRPGDWVKVTPNNITGTPTYTLTAVEEPL